MSLAFIVSRASGQSAQILARARSPLESFVPPLFTLVEDVDDHVERLVGPGDLLDVKVDLGDAEQAS